MRFFAARGEGKLRPRYPKVKIARARPHEVSAAGQRVQSPRRPKKIAASKATRNQVVRAPFSWWHAGSSMCRGVWPDKGRPVNARICLFSIIGNESRGQAFSPLYYAMSLRLPGFYAKKIRAAAWDS